MRPQRALVVDDDDDMRALVAELLRADGFDVVEKADGEAALDLLDSTVQDPDACPEVLIIDVKMPKFSGLGVIDALRRAQVDLPVIVMTALDDRSVTTLARRLGALDVLHKPIAADDLRSAVRSACMVRGRIPPRPRG